VRVMCRSWTLTLSGRAAANTAACIQAESLAGLHRLQLLGQLDHAAVGDAVAQQSLLHPPAQVTCAK
jgi:hypothetical protein